MALGHSGVNGILITDINITETTYCCQF